MDRRSLTSGAAALMLSTLTTVAVTAASPATAAERAQAVLHGCTDDSISGFATLTEIPSDQGVKEVDIYLQVEGISPGPHGVHIHETASCTPCGSAGGHFDPGPVGLTSPDGNHPYHSGDLVNVQVESDGIGVLTATTTRVSISDGPLSIFDDDNSAFIVHINEDTFCPDGVVAGCAGGGRAACGIIERPNTPEPFRLAVSKFRDRDDANLLNRNVLSGNVFVFLDPEFPPRPRIDSVDFFIDGGFVKTERYPPYDLFGTFRSGGARFNTRALEDGEHTIAAKIRLASGDVEFRTATFEIRNGGGIPHDHSMPPAK